MKKYDYQLIAKNNEKLLKEYLLNKNNKYI